MKVSLARRAERDLDDIARYLGRHSPSGAGRVEGQIQAALRLIATYPFVGRERRSGVRRFAIPRYPYLIFYGVNEEADEVVIFTIRHASRRPV